MSYEQIGAINKVELEIAPSPSAQVPPPVQAQRASEIKPVEPKAEEKKAAPPPENTATPIVTSDVHLRFIVNPETDHVTIVVMDRTNNKIIRTIPPEEFNQIKAGDLVELLA